MLFSFYLNYLNNKTFNLAKIAPDKWKHFFVGILMGVALQAFTFYAMPMHYIFSIVTAFIFVIVISYGFELFSLVTKKGHYDVGDAIAGTIGGAIGMGIILLFKLFFLS